jgi:hypothetical protein
MLYGLFWNCCLPDIDIFRTMRLTSVVEGQHTSFTQVYMDITYHRYTSRSCVVRHEMQLPHSRTFARQKIRIFTPTKVSWVVLQLVARCSTC